jgi:O-antigen ligase
MFLIVTIDVADYTDRSGSPLRYGILLIPLFGTVLVIVRSGVLRVRRLSTPDRILGLFMAYGLLGSLYGRLRLHETSGALPVFLPMLVAFTYVFATWQLTEEEADRITRRLAWIGLVYAFFNVLANLSVLSSAFPKFIAPKTYRNSKVFFVALGAAAAWTSRRRPVLACLLVLATVIFVTYRSGTNAVVFLVTLLTFFVTKPRGSPLRPYVVAAAGVAILAFAVINFNSTAGVASDYFQAVAKKNNNNARIALYQNGFQTFKKSPWVGSAFTGDITETVIRRDGLGAPFKAPFHDDYIMVAATGGLLGLFLMVWWIAATEVVVLRRYRGFLASGEDRKAGLLRVLLVAFNVLFVAALFNPELSAVGRGASIFGLYALMMLVGEPMRAAAGAVSPRALVAGAPRPRPALGSAGALPGRRPARGRDR